MTMQIKCTTDYSLFKFHPEQRPITDAHTRRIMESMKKHGFIEAYHITVNEQFQIVDGQHRYAAAKLLGLPVYYAIQNLDMETVQTAGGTNRAWTALDYVKSFAAQGKESYLRLEGILDKVNRGTTQVLRILGVQSGPAYNKFISGEWTMEDQDEQLIFDVLSLVDGLRPFAQGVADSAYFLSALCTMERTVGFSRTRLLEKAAFQSARITKQADPNSYVTMLEGIYNYRTTERSRLFFKRTQGGHYR